MNLDAVLAQIDFEISRLTQARELLAESQAVQSARRSKPPRRPSLKPRLRHRMSAAGRAKIAAAQRARWAKTRAVKQATSSKNAKIDKSK